MSTGPKQVNNRKHAGGRPPTYKFSDRERKRLIKAARDEAKRRGKGVEDILLEILYDDDDKRMQLNAIKLFYDIMIVPASEKDVTTHKQSGEPAIFLPQQKGDPAKVVELKKAE